MLQAMVCQHLSTEKYILLAKTIPHIYQYLSAHLPCLYLVCHSSAFVQLNDCAEYVSSTYIIPGAFQVVLM